METCTINKVMSKIRHEPTRSEMYPLSSDNARTQQSKEGLNGSVFVDEVHVVDREFVSRISRAGISRSEPLFAEFSTSGNDPTTYGKDRFDLALRVIAGTEERQSLFAAVYAAPQDLKDDDLASDPMKWGRMANPAMGNTVDPDEYLDDYRKSSLKPSDLAEFKMYRLNVWQSSSNPFLRMSDWKACQRDYDEDELRGLPCCAGLDLALKWDTTAFVLVFPWDDPEHEEKCYRVTVPTQCVTRWIGERMRKTASSR
jgi:phage terminase large subunit-like protein